MDGTEYPIERFYDDCRRLPGVSGQEIRQILQAGSVIRRSDPLNSAKCAEELSLALRLNADEPNRLLTSLAAFFDAQRKPTDLTFSEVAAEIYDAPFYPIAEHLIFAFPYGQRRADTVLAACDRSLTHARSGAAVLDVGVGPGVIARRLLEKRQDLALDILDISERCLRYAERVLVSSPVRSRIHTDFRDYPAEAKYDVIIASEVVEHVESPLDALAHLRTCLKSDGILILGVPIRLPMTMHLTVLDSVENVFTLAERAGYLIDEGFIYPLYGGSLDVTVRLMPREITAPATWVESV